MRKLFYIFFILFFCSNALGQSLTDVQFFEALNLDYPGLVSVKKSVNNKKYDDAKHQFVDYLKQRTKPVWYFDWRENDSNKRKTGVNISEANRFADNELLSCGQWYKFGSRVNWTYNATKNKGK